MSRSWRTGEAGGPLRCASFFLAFIMAVTAANAQKYTIQDALMEDDKMKTLYINSNPDSSIDDQLSLEVKVFLTDTFPTDEDVENEWGSASVLATFPADELTGAAIMNGLSLGDYQLLSPFDPCFAIYAVLILKDSGSSTPNDWKAFPVPVDQNACSEKVDLTFTVTQDPDVNPIVRYIEGEVVYEGFSINITNQGDAMVERPTAVAPLVMFGILIKENDWNPKDFFDDYKTFDLQNAAELLAEREMPLLKKNNSINFVLLDNTEKYLLNEDSSTSTFKGTALLKDEGITIDINGLTASLSIPCNRTHVLIGMINPLQTTQDSKLENDNIGLPINVLCPRDMSSRREKSCQVYPDISTNSRDALIVGISNDTAMPRGFIAKGFATGGVGFINLADYEEEVNWLWENAIANVIARRMRIMNKCSANPTKSEKAIENSMLSKDSKIIDDVWATVDRDVIAENMPTDVSKKQAKAVKAGMKLFTKLVQTCLSPTFGASRFLTQYSLSRMLNGRLRSLVPVLDFANVFSPNSANSFQDTMSSPSQGMIKKNSETHTLPVIRDSDAMIDKIESLFDEDEGAKRRKRSFFSADEEFDNIMDEMGGTNFGDYDYESYDDDYDEEESFSSDLVKKAIKNTMEDLVMGAGAEELKDISYLDEETRQAIKDVYDYLKGGEVIGAFAAIQRANLTTAETISIGEYMNSFMRRMDFSEESLKNIADFFLTNVSVTLKNRLTRQDDKNTVDLVKLIITALKQNAQGITKVIQRALKINRDEWESKLMMEQPGPEPNGDMICKRKAVNIVNRMLSKKMKKDQQDDEFLTVPLEALKQKGMSKTYNWFRQNSYLYRGERSKYTGTNFFKQFATCGCNSDDGDPYYFYDDDSYDFSGSDDGDDYSDVEGSEFGNDIDFNFSRRKRSTHAKQGKTVQRAHSKVIIPSMKEHLAKTENGVTVEGPVIVVNKRGQMASICDDTDWEANDAKVVCGAMLRPMLSKGYELISWGTSSAPQAETQTSLVISKLHCRGNEFDILKCAHVTGSKNCAVKERARVRCVVQKKKEEENPKKPGKPIVFPGPTKQPDQ